MNENRNILFIGHANPEDNEFTLWIRQKLINEGYKTECDLTILVGGENDYWKDIQECLEKNTIKYLLILSKHTFNKPGVLDEWEHIRSLIKKFKLKDFIIPLKIDNVDYNTRIGLNRINIINFSNSWALGLKKVIRKLEKDSIPKTKVDSQLSIREWFINRYGFGQGVEEKEEVYYSNWVEINNIPEKVYLFEYANNTQAEFINSQLVYPNIRHDKFIITFEDEIKAQLFIDYSLLSKNDSLIIYRNKKEILVSDITKNVESENFPKLQDSKNFLIRLLKDAFDKYLINKNLNHYTYSGSNLKCYYYEKTDIEDDPINFNENSLDFSETDINKKEAVDPPYKVSFPYHDEKKRKKLVGKYFDSIWHLGVSINVKLFPVVVFEIKSHIVFSDDGINIWEDKDKLHKARRYKGKRFFNEEWRDLLFAFLYSLKDEAETIKIPIKDNHSISLSTTPLSFNSKIGYKEPESKARLIPINEFIDDELEEESNITEDINETP